MKSLAVLVCYAVVAISSIALLAHQETFKGKVVSAEGTSVSVNVVDAKTKKETATTFTTNEKTKVLRGDAVVTLTNAKIRKDESIAVTVDHDVDVRMALVIRLDAAK